MNKILNLSNGKYKYWLTGFEDVEGHKPLVYIICSLDEYKSNIEKARIVKECGLNTEDYTICFKENYDN